MQSSVLISATHDSKADFIGNRLKQAESLERWGHVEEETGKYKDKLATDREKAENAPRKKYSRAEDPRVCLDRIRLMSYTICFRL